MNFEYRLGDLVMSRVHPWYPMHHCKYFPSSIACEYLKSLSDCRIEYDAKYKENCIYNHLDTLEHVIENRLRNMPKKHRLALHLRLGDTVDTEPYKSYCKNAVNQGCKYVYPIHFYDKLKIASNLSVVVFTNTKKGTNKYAQNSHNYILNIYKQFEKNQIFVIDNRFADDDLLDMLSSTYLIPSRGGEFANILRKIAPRFNVTIVDPSRHNVYIN